MDISSINPIRTNPIGDFSNPVKSVGQTDKIAKTFDQFLSSLTQSDSSTNDLTTAMATGQDVDLHNVMISAEENDVNFRVAIAIRDRLVDAYREVMRMSI